VAAEAFAVMREGMTGRAAIGKLALYGREYLVAIQPRERGLVMFTLRHASEVRAMGDIDELKTVPASIKPDEVKLARQVIGSFEAEGDLTQYRDDYQMELRRIIDAKVAGEEVVQTAEEAPPKVVNLMDALRQSLERVSADKKRAAKIAKPATVKSIRSTAARKRARA
jgi:DNA end-binding protein Ku